MIYWIFDIKDLYFVLFYIFFFWFIFYVKWYSLQRFFCQMFDDIIFGMVDCVLVDIISYVVLYEVYNVYYI